jgi:hypothetical protein
MQTNLSRVGKIGASELSFVREYRHPLLEKNIINEEIFEQLESMNEKFCQTRYSTAQRLQLDEDQLDAFQTHLLEEDRKKRNSSMTRGKSCEQMMMEQWLNENEGWEIIDSQARVEKHLVGVEMPLIVTTDFIVQKNGRKKIIECKTKEIKPDNDYSIGVWEKYKAAGCSFSHVMQVNQQMSFLGISEAEIITGAVICRSEGKGKNKTFEYEISDNFTQKLELSVMLDDAICVSVGWLDYELKNNRDAILNKPDFEKTKADLEIDAFLEDFTATKEEIANAELSKKILRFQELKPLIQEAKSLEEEIKSEIKQVMGISRKLRLKSNSFEVNASYTKPSFLDEDGVVAGIKKAEEALEFAKKIEIGTAKSKPSLRWQVETTTE